MEKMKWGILCSILLILLGLGYSLKTPESDDRKRIKFGPIRSPFISDVNSDLEEEEEYGNEHLEEDEVNARKQGRNNVLYFLISSFANASDNLKTLVKFLLCSNQLILGGWIAFIIAIFVLSYLFTTNPLGQLKTDERIMAPQDERDGEIQDDDEDKDSPSCLKGSSGSIIAYSKPPLEKNRDRLHKSLSTLFASRNFKARLDGALLECIQGSVQLLEEENETAAFSELSIDYPTSEQILVITGRAQDFKRTFLFDNDNYWTLRNIKFFIESKNQEFIFKIPFEGNELIFEKECKDLAQTFFVSLDVSKDMEAHFISPYRQKSSMIRATSDSLVVDVLRLTGADNDNLHISLMLDEPSPQSLLSRISPFKAPNSDLIWNTQFSFAISPYKSKKLSMEVIEEDNGKVIGLANISTSDLHLVPNQMHTLPLLHPSSFSPSPRFLSVQLFYKFSPASNSIQNAQGERDIPLINKTIESTLSENQLIHKTSYELQGHKKTSLEEKSEEGLNAIVAKAALNNLLGMESGRSSSPSSNPPFRSTMLITSVQKVPSMQVVDCKQTSFFPPVENHHSSLEELNGFDVDRKSEVDELSIEIEYSIESLPLSPPSSQRRRESKPLVSSNLTVPTVNPLKKSKENFISSLKRIISGPSLYSLDINSPRPRIRLYSSPSRLEKKRPKAASSAILSISLKSLTKDILSSRLHLGGSRRHQESSDIGYSSDSDSECSLELKSDWMGPRSLSWESWDSGASYLLLPGEGEGSSMSDISGVSGTSYAVGGNAVKKGGKSLLVFETQELGYTRHYLIPQYKRGRTRLGKKQGSKLHVFNNHLFIAKHIKRGTHCSVCRKRIILRLGKQGYVCRDCGKICHKQCHEKVEDICMKSTFPSMELFRGSTIIKRKGK
eukprot:TRINITY_DN255_c0_g1_i13.p1 TRINITY_DN255_c0_g1~~TRINITY_DN255_c0_g1_i13.p1  ORF type:complete len:896 (-),score=125.37 TRINITY_DN255_c0_g1_i13:572-3259(-)